MNTATTSLLEFVNGELLPDSAQRVNADTPLFADGLVDSLKILQLIAFVEMKTGQNISDRDVVMENFRTVQTIIEHFYDAEPIANQ
ncbi:MAG: acyl carrier protein [Verrucomicrobia bacterium]|nr:acyl carrier protein [Verrucomicrobiota bacterium]